MTIKDLEEATGMGRAKIRFYEKEGFLAPARQDNGYRDYSEKELELLMKIKLLRDLEMPLEQIRALIEGRELLGNALSQKIMEFQQEKNILSNMQRVCRIMQDRQETFSDLKAGEYIALLEQAAIEEGKTGLEDWTPPPRIYAPHRRQFARGMDYMITLDCCLAFVVLALHIQIRDSLIFYGIVCLAAFLTLAVEPYLLHFFATTPGKAVFGMHIRKVNGKNLTVLEGRERIHEMIATDLCVAFSSRNSAEYNAVYWDSSKRYDLPWEKHNHAYTIEDISIVRSLVYIVIYALLMVFAFYLISI